MKKTNTLNELSQKAVSQIYSKNNYPNKLKKEDSTMKPSESTIQNILNFSKALAVFDTKISDTKGMMLMN